MATIDGGVKSPLSRLEAYRFLKLSFELEILSLFLKKCKADFFPNSEELDAGKKRETAQQETRGVIGRAALALADAHVVGDDLLSQSTQRARMCVCFSSETCLYLFQFRNVSKALGWLSVPREFLIRVSPFALLSSQVLIFFTIPKSNMPLQFTKFA